MERLSKGVYYRPRQTALGKSRPNPGAIRELAGRRKAMFPSGLAAANLLGFTTQNARRGEIATSATSLPRKLVGSDAVIHTRRPEWLASEHLATLRVPSVDGWWSRVTRLHRLHDQKTEVLIYDYADLHIPMLARMHARRIKGYEAIGYRVRKGSDQVQMPWMERQHDR
ncbi:MAG: hypothetical protein KKI08_18115 [Armatimonadetes bacterium]|nr:hypothetical protein [Armatimonadota bacterium]